MGIFWVFKGIFNRLCLPGVYMYKKRHFGLSKEDVHTNTFDIFSNKQYESNFWEMFWNFT